MAIYTFHLPDLGEGLLAAKVLEWLVAVGDDVDRKSPLADVETEKSAIELPCPVSGRVTALHAEEGDTVLVGKPLVTFETAEQAGIVGTVPHEDTPTRSVRLRPPDA
ncbi:hypothetical protein Aple_075910 [Acrocarpospora pleiomorpha]|uniref:Lipoyl-binding domain-containing protein n=1 Tax=Acrocarpospora pleiomorpha TaxID=90975 RepID=A0A5M3XUL8_9ACTN|nr:biotin/lipoyl-containing protein [Acrocarpospora pleiomorpha]GES24692.1 hypothetical protein Aple_075910 [Acrocarpospora pleiomorpha]